MTTTKLKRADTLESGDVLAEAPGAQRLECLQTDDGYRHIIDIGYDIGSGMYRIFVDVLRNGRQYTRYAYLYRDAEERVEVIA